MSSIRNKDLFPIGTIVKHYKRSSTVDPNNVPQSIWNYFIGKGLTPAGVAGLMGNLKHESYCSPYTTEDGETVTKFTRFDPKVD